MSVPNLTVTVDGPYGYTWAEWHEIVDFLGQLEYECEFDCNGCKSNRKHAGSAGRGCCGGCHNGGYGVNVPPEGIETVEALYDDKDGFWTPTGCSLPTEYKSRVCWSAVCREKGVDPAKDKIWEAIKNLHDGPDWPYRKGRPLGTVEEVKALAQDAGVLREQQLVTIS